jgi:hypothetical protein
MDFPLKKDFFPQIHLDTKEKNKYIDLVQSSVQTLHEFFTQEEKKWKKIQVCEGLDVNKVVRIETNNGEIGKSTGNACLVMNASIYVKGTIHEVLEAIASPRTEDYRKAMKFLYKESFLDGICLNTILPSNESKNTTKITKKSTQTLQHPTRTMLKWCAFVDDPTSVGTGMMGMMGSMGTMGTMGTMGIDYCFLEHVGVHLDWETQQVMYGFCIQESLLLVLV